MSFQAQVVANKIYSCVSKAQIEAVTSCMTRLRLTVKQPQLLDLAELKQIAGVLGVVVNGNQVQVILGPGKVNQVYECFMPVYESATAVISSPHLPAISQQKQELNKNRASAILKRLANIFVPLIPAFIGCGLILGLLNVLIRIGVACDLSYLTLEHNSFLALARVIGNGIGFGLTLFVGINAAREFGGTPALGGVLAAVLTMPDLAAVSIMGQAATPGRGGVIAVLLVTIAAAYLERYLRKIIPSALDLFVTPTLVLLCAGSLAVYILQPLGGLLSDAICQLAQDAISHGGALAGFGLSALFLPLVMTGLHQGLLPIHAELIKATGSTILLPVLAMAGAGQVGAAIAVWLKTANPRLRHLIKSSIVVGFLGIGEPLIYGVTLPLVRPFIAACIGGGLGGAFVAYFKLGATGLGISGLPLTLLIANGMGLYLVGLGLAYLGGFIATWLIGFDDSILE